jgi:hypothetical protein
MTLPATLGFGASVAGRFSNTTLAQSLFVSVIVKDSNKP